MISNTVLKAKEYISDLLSPLKNKWYEFHNLDHTLSVYKRASYLAQMEWLDEEMQEIIQLAALFHDTWFIKQYDNNEPIWSEIAEKWLKEQKIPEDKIDIIKQVILATILGSPTNTILEKIIKDSDMDNLWRDDFFLLEEALRNELKNIKNIKFTDKERYDRINSYIQPFKFYTETQIKERNQKFKENKEILKDKIESAKQ